jgi:putative redox protein
VEHLDDLLEGEASMWHRRTSEETDRMLAWGPSDDRTREATVAVTIEIAYVGDLHCEAVHGPSGDRFVTDAPVDNGGKGDAFSPTDLVATALGTCLSTVMGIVAKRREIDLAGTRVTVVKEMTSVPIRRIGALTATITVPGGARLSTSDRALLERTADTCPVRQSLHPDVAVTMNFVYQE